MSADYLFKSVENKSNSFSNEMKVKEVQLLFPDNSTIEKNMHINGIHKHLELQF